MNRAVTVLLSLISLLLALSTASSLSSEREKKGQFDAYLPAFDFECLQKMMEDAEAVRALELVDLLLPINPDYQSLAVHDLMANEIQDHLSCVEVTSRDCGEVEVFPTSVSNAAIAITGEIDDLSDTELLQLVDLNFTLICNTTQEILSALEPYHSCILHNVNAYENLPLDIKHTIPDTLVALSNTSQGSAWNYDLIRYLDLPQDCPTLLQDVASVIRGSLDYNYWDMRLLQFALVYSLGSFDESVSYDLSYGTADEFGCRIPLEMICTNMEAVFYAVCELVAQKDFDFFSMEPLYSNFSVGSPYYKSFEEFAMEDSPDYPCVSTFEDPCYGPYLNLTPSIPDLGLNQGCREAVYYHSLQDNTSFPTNSSSAGSTPTSAPENSKNGLSGGSIAGIVIGVLLVATAGVVAGVFWWKRRTPSSPPYEQQMD